MRVKITAYLEPEPHEVDEDDDSGLTNEAYEKVMDEFIGYDDVEIEKVDD